MKRYPKISVLMPIYHEEKMLPGALESLLNSDYPDLEVIIGIDTKEDRTLDIAKRYAKNHKNILIDFSPVRRGATGAMDSMIKKAKGSIVLKFDADHRIGNPSKFFYNLARRFEDKGLGGLCIFGYGDIEDRKLLLEIERKINKSWAARGERVACVLVDLFKESKLPINKVPNFPIDVNAFRKSAVSGLDPNVVHDDALLAYKILEKSYKIDVAPDVLVVDFGHPTSFNRFLNQRVKGSVGWQDLSKKYNLDLKSYYLSLFGLFIRNIRKFSLKDDFAFTYWISVFVASMFISFFRKNRKPTEVWKKRT
jgi:cellulose synthase/poly-beta-1,6-N-acetylglucosamine synthase-like glycosyltransferase